jgi:acetyl-CoA/propionyl-CoA carboxylase
MDKIKTLLSYLPQNNKEEPEILAADVDDPNRLDTNLISVLPDNPYQSYDMKEIITSIVDSGNFFEVHELFAENIVVGFARMAGRSVGIISNQP